MTSFQSKIILSVCLLICTLLSGCQQVQVQEYDGVKVSLENGSFPKELVGVWKDVENWGWSIEFTKEGRIAEIEHPIAGYITMKPGETTEWPMKDGGTSRYVPGLWQVKYNRANQYLNVEIIIDDLFAEIGKTTLTGNGSDLIYGPLTDDLKVWKAEWVALRELSAITEEHPEGAPLPIDPDDTWVYITFVKVEPEPDTTHRRAD